MSNTIEILDKLLRLQKEKKDTLNHEHKMFRKKDAKQFLTICSLLWITTIMLSFFRGYPEVDSASTAIFTAFLVVLTMFAMVSFFYVLLDRPKRMLKEIKYNKINPSDKTSNDLVIEIYNILESLDKKDFIECSKEIHMNEKYEFLEEMFEEEFDNRVEKDKKKLEKLKRLELNIALYDQEESEDETLKNMIKNTEKSIESISIQSN